MLDKRDFINISKEFGTASLRMALTLKNWRGVIRKINKGEIEENKMCFNFFKNYLVEKYQIWEIEKDELEKRSFLKTVQNKHH